MEQAMLILTEYASWIPVGIGVLSVILLAVTLRRIKKIRKQQKEILGNIQLLQDRVEWVLEMQRSDAARKQADVLRAKQAREVQADNTKERPEELINAVLEEVFS